MFNEILLSRKKQARKKTGATLVTIVLSGYLICIVLHTLDERRQRKRNAPRQDFIFQTKRLENVFVVSRHNRFHQLVVRKYDNNNIITNTV